MKKRLNFSLLVMVTIIGVTLSQRSFAQEKSTAETQATQKVVNLTPDQAEKLLSTNKQVIVLDVRTPEEFKSSHIHGATNVDFYQDFERNLAKLDKSKPYLVHCAVGGRSAKVRDRMKQLSFKSIYHLEGGIKAWEKAGKKTEK